MGLPVIFSSTGKWGTKTEYTNFRKFLMKDGYLRIAPEVFMRAVTNRKGTTKHFRRIIVGNIVVYFQKMGYNVITRCWGQKHLTP